MLLKFTFKHKKFISFLLILCTVFSMCSQFLTVFAVDGSGIENEIAEKGNISDYSELNDIGLSETEAIKPNDALLTIDHPSIAKESMISKYVNAEAFNKASHVERLHSEEDLNTYVFLNANGTKSIYYMYENVKYVDKNGDVKEKDISLVSKSDGYGIARNEFDLHIPISATSGISVSYNGYEVKITPQSTARTAPARQAGETVVYDGFFGTNTSLVYTPMLSGVKEDIILNKYIPNASFSFILETDGLGLYSNNEGYYLAESESSKAVLRLGKVIIYDAVGKPEYGTMAVKTVTDKQKYILSLSAPEEFLTDPTTVYPVTIDPTLTFSDTATGEGAIEDTVLFSGRPSRNYGDYKYLSIGYVDSTYGAGRVAVKLPGLYNSADYNAITASNITSVKFYCWDTSGNSAQTVNLYRITSAAWNENSVTFGDSVTYSTSQNWGKSMPNGAWTDFDITTLVKGWKNGSYSADKGFIMVNPNETSSSYKKAPYSSETTTSYRPYVVMTIEGNLNISLSSMYLLVDQTKQIPYSATPSSLNITWSSNNTSVADVTNSGVVYPLSEGSAMIMATYTDATGTERNVYVYVYVRDSIGIADATKYYIMNYSSGRYLSLVSNTDVSLTNVVTNARSTELRSQWKTEKQVDGTYQLISVFSSTGKVLDVTGTNIDICADNDAVYQKFMVYRINTNDYKGMYYIRYNDYYVAQDSNYNVYLTPTPSQYAVWSFMAVDQRKAELFCHDYEYILDGNLVHYDTTHNCTDFCNIMNSLGYTSEYYINPSASTAYEGMKENDDIFIFRGHGNAGIISFNTEGNISTGVIAINGIVPAYYPSGNDRKYISYLDKNELAKSRCVIYLGCRTGVDLPIGNNAYNLVDETFDKGAHFVYGTTARTNNAVSRIWLSAFLSSINSGKSIHDAIADADEAVGYVMLNVTNANGTESEQTVYGIPSYNVGDKEQYLKLNNSK